MIACLEPDTHLTVFPKSIRGDVQLESVVLSLNPGDVVFFRCDLVHAGYR